MSLRLPYVLAAIALAFLIGWFTHRCPNGPRPTGAVLSTNRDSTSTVRDRVEAVLPPPITAPFSPAGVSPLASAYPSPLPFSHRPPWEPANLRTLPLASPSQSIRRCVVLIIRAATRWRDTSFLATK